MKRRLFWLADRLGLNALARRAHRGKLKVLLYHNVGADPAWFPDSISNEEFERHLIYLKRRYALVRMRQDGQIEGYEPGRVNILITFDDGFANNAIHAAPILARHGISGLFFLIAGCIAQGDPPAFRIDRAPAGADLVACRTVTAIEMRAMAAQGMTIGSHSLRHEDFRTKTDEDARRDAVESKALLETQLNEAVENFAFPWGYHRPGQGLRIAQAYARVFLTDHGFCDPGDKILFRNEVSDLDHLGVAASGLLDGVKRLFATARRQG